MSQHFRSLLTLIVLVWPQYTASETQTTAPSAVSSVPGVTAAGLTAQSVTCSFELSEIALLKEQISVVSRTPSWSTPSAVTSVSLALIAMVSLSFSFYQFNRGRADNDGWKNREIRAARRLKLLEALLWFESPLHQRSAALAVVEGHWEEYPELHATWTAVLVANSVEIVVKPDTNLSARDQHDLQRMLELLSRNSSSDGKLTTGSRIIDPIIAALEELSTRIVLSVSGEYVSPNRRQRFITEVKTIADQYPQICSKG